MSALFEWPTWVVAGLVLSLMFVTNEFGFRLAARSPSDESELSRSVSNALKASVFGLVAFLLGFSFTIAASKHDARRQVVLDEANAIGTCYLRAGLLDNRSATEIRDILRTYVDSRLAYFDDAPDPAKVQAAVARMHRSLDALWNEVEQQGHDHPTVVHTSRIIPAANEVIDLSSTRAWIAASHLQPTVLVLLVVCVLVSSLLIGHSSGQARRRHIGLWAAFNVLFAMVLYVVIDFDRPRRGLILVDHAPLIDLRESMQ